MEFTTIQTNIAANISFATEEWEGTKKTKDTFMEEVESYTTFKVANFITTYWFPVLIPIGFVGNHFIISCYDQTKQQENVNLYLHGSYKCQ